MKQVPELYRQLDETDNPVVRAFIGDDETVYITWANGNQMMLDVHGTQTRIH